jgi:hypothetical protein
MVPCIQQHLQLCLGRPNPASLRRKGRFTSDATDWQKGVSVSNDLLSLTEMAALCKQAEPSEG